MTTASRAVRELRPGYSRASVRRNVGIDVRRHEIVALFGSNGSGKTSLLRAISGSMPWCKGTVELDGQAIGHLPSWRRARLWLSHVPYVRHCLSALTAR